MKRLLADTNFYGLLAKDPKRIEVVGSIKTNKNLLIYGFRIIRNELRDVPKKIKIEGKNLRIDLLSLYDEITGEHIIEFTDIAVKRADDYYKAYREFGGSKSKNEIINDFIENAYIFGNARKFSIFDIVIVACASLKSFDIIVSNDERSMLAENAIRAYKLVNSVISKRTPRFISYEKFRMILRGEPNEFF